MSTPESRSEYLVISRGQWDHALPPERIQTAIDDFYLWLDRMVEQGKMRGGSRLTTGGKTVSRRGVTDGPYGEAKEAIGGYWFIIADSLDEAAELMKQNPTVACGLLFELRPLEPVRATAFNVTNETPDEKRG